MVVDLPPEPKGGLQTHQTPLDPPQLCDREKQMKYELREKKIKFDFDERIYLGQVDESEFDSSERIGHGSGQRSRAIRVTEIPSLIVQQTCQVRMGQTRSIYV